MERGRWRAWLALLLLLVASAATRGRALSPEPEVQDPYKMLGVRRSATQREVTQAFRRLSRQWHPDKNTSPEATARFQQISAAYDRLTQEGATPPPPWAASRPPSAASMTEYVIITAVEGWHVVMDLDPVRLWRLSEVWLQDWAARHEDTFGPLWRGSVDRGACWCLEQTWRLPQLAEPLAPWVARLQGRKYVAGSWRTWRLSGVLLEMSAWSAKQPHCLAHAAHSSSSGSGSSGSSAHAREGGEPQAAAAAAQQEPAAAAEALARLQLQLDVRRRARQQAVQEQQRRQQRQHQRSNPGGSSSSARAQEEHAPSATERVDAGNRATGAAAAADTAQTAAVWLVLLLSVSWLLLHDRLLLVVAFAAAAAALCGIWNGLLLPSEASVQQLAALLDSDSMQAGMVKLWLLAAWLSAVVLAPLLLAGALALLLTWTWAAVTFLSFAMTPALSQCGLAVWLGLQAYGVAARGGRVQGAAVLLGLAGLVYKVPRLALWWLGLLLAPAALLLHFFKQMLLASCPWWPRSTASSGDGSGSEQAGQQGVMAGRGAADAAAAADDAGDVAAAGDAGAAAVQEAAAVPLDDEAPGTLAQDQQQQRVQVADIHAAVSARERGGPVPHDSSIRSSSSGSRGRGKRTTRQPQQQQQQAPKRLLPDGPWWPNSFGAADLAATSHWYALWVGWRLARWALAVAAISCKLTLLLALAGTSLAAFGAPAGWLSLQVLVQLVLLRGGLACGLAVQLWRLQRRRHTSPQA